MLSHLVKLAVQSVTVFVHKTLEIGAQAPREGFFRAKLVFSDEGRTLEIGAQAPREGFFRAKLVFSDEGS